VKIANHRGRAVLVLGDRIADVADASDGRFGPDPQRVYDDWPAFVAFASGVTEGTAPLVEADLACPVPSPRQVFAIGLNYRSHAEESGMEVPAVPATFTKFPASLAGPFDDVPVVSTTVPDPRFAECAAGVLLGASVDVAGGERRGRARVRVRASLTP